MTHCIECGRPWGVVLDRGEEPTEERERQTRDELVDILLHEVWDCDYDPEVLASVDTTKLPPVYSARVVFISEATADFIGDHGFGDAYMGDCWQELVNVDIPLWLLKGRKQRWAIRWDCCNIGSPNLYRPVSVELGS